MPEAAPDEYVCSLSHQYKCCTVVVLFTYSNEHFNINILMWGAVVTNQGTLDAAEGQYRKGTDAPYESTRVPSGLYVRCSLVQTLKKPFRPLYPVPPCARTTQTLEASNPAFPWSHTDSRTSPEKGLLKLQWSRRVSS